MIALLIRHGRADAVDVWLAGRRPDVVLNEAGREETARLVRALTWAPLAAIYASPLQRAVETAFPIAADHALKTHVRPALTDIDLGMWTGKTLEELSGDSAWLQF